MAGRTDGVAGIFDSAYRDFTAYLLEFAAPFRARGGSAGRSQSPEMQAAVEDIGAEVSAHDIVVYGLAG